MRNRVQTEITTMFMIYDGNKVLVQNRTDSSWPGISFPGGHVESGESFTESVIREIREETGLTIRHPVLCGLKDWENDDNSRYIVLFYKTNEFDGQLTSSQEGDVFWVDKADLSHYPLAPDFDDMYPMFFNDQVTEFFYRPTRDGWKKEIV